MGTLCKTRAGLEASVGSDYLDDILEDLIISSLTYTKLLKRFRQLVRKLYVD